MNGARAAVAIGVLCASVATAGCGLGAGAEQGRAGLRVTSDYGEELLTDATPSVRDSDSVLDLLDGAARIETRFGGGFVQSIDGLAGGSEDGRRFDWFFYVNGIESPVGAAEVDAAEGDRIWWDHRDWTDAMRVPAVVGSWPEPFVHGFMGEAYRPAVRCFTAAAICDRVKAALRDAGANTDPRASETEVLVGPWAELDGEPAARLLGSAPSRSGVFARFAEAGLQLLDARAQVVETLHEGAGLIAAVRPGDGAPIWLITGTDAAGVAAAAAELGDGLRDHYAVAVGRDGPTALPLGEGS